MKQEHLTNRQKQSITTKKKIYDTTVDLLETCDFNEVTIRKICKEADVSTGTFYLYFKSKHEILLETYKDVDAIFRNADLLNRRDLNCLKRIEEIIRIQITFASEQNIDISKVLYAHHINSYNTDFFSEERDFFLILNAIVAAGQDNGEIADFLLSEEITWKILRFSRGMIFDWLSRGADYDIVEVTLNDLSLYLNVFKSEA